LRRIDTLYGAIYDLPNLFYFKAWPKHIPLAFIAAVTWYVFLSEITHIFLTTTRLLPLVSIVTPSTIAVQPHTRQSSELIPTGEVDFASSGYASTIRGKLNAQNVLTTRGLSAIQYLTLTTGKVAAVPHEYHEANISYQSAFYGPAMSCVIADNTTFAYVNRSISQYEQSRNIDIYIASFVPETGFGPRINGSYFNKTNVIQDDPLTTSPHTDLVSSDVSKTFVRLRHSASNFTLYSCNLYNATYVMQFNLYTNGHQDITARTELLNPIAIRDYISLLRPDSVAHSPDNIIRTYISISTLVNGVLSGALWSQHNRAPEHSLMSILVYSESLKVTFNLTELNNVIPFYEEVFRNITISARYGLHASNFGFPSQHNFDKHRLNSTVNATLSVIQNQFVYQPRDLMLAYGVGILATAVCVCLGGFAILKSGGSFSYKFSTIFRFLQNVQFSLHQEETIKGNADPLPRNIERLSLSYNNEL